jgi:putative addiction module killer protein
VEINHRSIEIYEQADGKRPYENWLNNLKDKMARARIRARIDKVATGNFGDCKSIDKGIFELRLNFGPGFRIYYAFKNETIVILLIGGDKSSQSKDIEKAKVYWNDFQERADEKSKH